MKEKKESIPRLTVPREEAKEKIENQINRGEKLVIRSSPSEDLLRELKSWCQQSDLLLKTLFDSEKIIDGCYTTGVIGRFSRHPPSISEQVEDEKRFVNNKIDSLKSLLDRIDMYDEVETIKTKTDPQPTLLSKKVFVVHGHDEAKHNVARFLEHLQLEPIILDEQPSASATVIEKFEKHSDVGFAVVLLSPDDTFILPGKPVKKVYRARQNVIFELGYFFGKLQRYRVCVLLKEGMEWPSDIKGIVYIPLDKEGAWKYKLAKEIKTSGINIDMNKIR